MDCKNLTGIVMTKSTLCQFLAVITLFSLTSMSFAWDKSLEIGYGYSHDPNHTKYNNSGVLLNGDFYTLRDTPATHWSLNAALGAFHTTTPVHENIVTAALDLALRLYAFDFGNDYTAYFLGSAGPAYLSNRRFGYNTQGSNLAIQTNLGVGAEFNQYDLNLRLEHFSNAGLAKPNEGFNVLYLLSFGYLF